MVLAASSRTTSFQFTSASAERITSSAGILWIVLVEPPRLDQGPYRGVEKPVGEPGKLQGLLRNQEHVIGDLHRRLPRLGRHGIQQGPGHVHAHAVVDLLEPVEAGVQDLRSSMIVKRYGAGGPKNVLGPRDRSVSPEATTHPRGWSAPRLRTPASGPGGIGVRDMTRQAQISPRRLTAGYQSFRMGWASVVNTTFVRSRVCAGAKSKYRYFNVSARK